MIIQTFEDLFGSTDLGIAGSIPDVSSGDGILRSDAQCADWAEIIGCDILKATDKQLFIDLDTEAQFQIFEFQIRLFKKHFHLESYRVEPSKQGLPHRHVTVNLYNSYPLMTRIAMQACLGSDPTREMLSIRRAQDNEDNVVIFFEKRK